MKKIILITLLLFSVNSYADFEDDEETSLSFDVAVFKVSREDARRAMLNAINYKNWKITSVTENEILIDYDGTKAKADFSKFPKITLVYTGDDTGSSGWFPAIKKNALVELVSCMN